MRWLFADSVKQNNYAKITAEKSFIVRILVFEYQLN